MFTGIITAIGTITEAEQRGDLRLTIACPWDTGAIAIGASIACSGVCLTVVDRGGAQGAGWFAVDVSAETIACTVPDMWSVERALNLEAALKMGDELGGHIVTGHVDGVGEVIVREDRGDSVLIAIRVNAELAPLIAAKGSIVVDGVSLTVNAITDQRDGNADFELNIIPHTGDVTTLGALSAGDRVNLEIDILARYLQRMTSLSAASTRNVT